MATKKRGMKRAIPMQTKAEVRTQYTTRSGKILNPKDIVTVHEAYVKHCIVVDKHNNWYDIPRKYLAKVG